MASNNEDSIRNTLNKALKSLHEPTYVKATHPFPCDLCQKNVNYNQKGLQCHECHKWTHIKCNNTDAETCNDLKSVYIDTINNANIVNRFKPGSKWLCSKCIMTKRAMVFPFGYEDNHDLRKP